MQSVGVVRDFRPDEGWGVVDGPAVPGGCWVHFSAIVGEGYRELTPGRRVSFHAESAAQDGFRFRATKVWLDGAEPADPPGSQATGTAYRSSYADVTRHDDPRSPYPPGTVPTPGI